MLAYENRTPGITLTKLILKVLVATIDAQWEGLVWFGLCCLMTPGLSKDIQCHV